MLFSQMGFLSELAVRQSELGYQALDSRVVCRDCVGEPDLAKFVEEHASADECDFCGRAATAVIAADADDVLAHIGRCLGLEYEPAIGALAHDSESASGYAGPTFWTEDALRRAGVELAAEPFASYVEEAFAGSLWTERDPYGLRPHEHDGLAWRAFCTAAESDPDLDAGAPLPALEDDDSPRGRVGDVLRTIGSYVQQTGLWRQLPEGARIVRGRPADPASVFVTAKDLGTPPDSKARDGRMNRAGEGVFYGAQQVETVRAELRGAAGRGEVLAIGEFETSAVAWLVDLSRLPAFPGLLNEHRNAEREPLRFLQGFRDDISRPAPPKDEAHTQYRPTQLVAHHLRTVRTPHGDAPSGIAYPSAPRPDGENLVLWVPREACIDLGEPSVTAGLELRLIETSTALPEDPL